MDELFELKEIYEQRKKEILDRLADFSKLKAASTKRLFEELCFCLLTPQSKAQTCDKIISDLKKDDLLYKGKRRHLRPFLKKARFYRNKTEYLLLARKLFIEGGCLDLKEKIAHVRPFEVRKWLVEHVKGLGLKEASHFLRNIGLGEDMAILDIHILRRLEETKVIDEVPKSLTQKRYLEIEEKVKKFSSKVGIPMAHLDLLFWSMGTGKIFK